MLPDALSINDALKKELKAAASSESECKNREVVILSENCYFMSLLVSKSKIVRIHSSTQNLANQRQTR